MSKGFYTNEELNQLYQAIEKNVGITYVHTEHYLMPSYEHPGYIQIQYENALDIMATPLFDHDEEEMKKNPHIKIGLYRDGKVFHLPNIPVHFTYKDIEADAKIYLDTMSSHFDKIAKIATVIMNSANCTQEDVDGLLVPQALDVLFSDDHGLYVVGIDRVALMEYIGNHVENYNSYPLAYETPCGLEYNEAEYMKALMVDEKDELLSGISRPH